MGELDRFLVPPQQPPDVVLRLEVERRELDARRARDAFAERLARIRAAEIPLEAGIAQCIARGDIADGELDGSLEPTKPLLVARSLVRVASVSENHARVVMFIGDPGRGKTVAGGYIIGHLGGRYMTLQEAVELATSKTAADKKLWKSLLRVRVLMIEELGFERDAALGKVVLHELVDRRQELITIFGSNLPREGRDGLDRRYDKRTLDRLHAADVVESGGRSFRIRRPWRRVFDFGEQEAVTPERVQEAYLETRRYYAAKAHPVEYYVELAHCRREALAELRIAEAA